MLEGIALRKGLKGDGQVDQHVTADGPLLRALTHSDSADVVAGPPSVGVAIEYAVEDLDASMMAPQLPARDERPAANAEHPQCEVLEAESPRFVRRRAAAEVA